MKKDRELIQEFQNGDEEAFNELVRKYLDLVHGFFQKITKHPEPFFQVCRRIGV